MTYQILAVFVLSWFSLIGQATAHSFMMVEMQQHKAMGHDMGSHCQPVLFETVTSLDDPRAVITNGITHLFPIFFAKRIINVKATKSAPVKRFTVSVVIDLLRFTKDIIQYNTLSN